MATCSVQDLMAVANFFNGLTGYQLALISTSLLCKILQNSNPVATCDVSSLLNDARCFECLTPYQNALIQSQLLCEILNAGGSSGAGCLLCSAASNPVNPPTCDCALFYRRDTGAMWFWDVGLGQWVLLIGP